MNSHDDRSTDQNQCRHDVRELGSKGQAQVDYRVFVASRGPSMKGNGSGDTIAVCSLSAPELQ